MCEHLDCSFTHTETITKTSDDVLYVLRNARKLNIKQQFLETGGGEGAEQHIKPRLKSHIIPTDFLRMKLMCLFPRSGKAYTVILEIGKIPFTNTDR